MQHKGRKHTPNTCPLLREPRPTATARPPPCSLQRLLFSGGDGVRTQNRLPRAAAAPRAHLVVRPPFPPSPLMTSMYRPFLPPPRPTTDQPLARSVSLISPFCTAAAKQRGSESPRGHGTNG